MQKMKSTEIMCYARNWLLYNVFLSFSWHLFILLLVSALTTKVFAGALRAAFLTILNEKTIGTDIYNEVFKFIVRGIVQQLFKD